MSTAGSLCSQHSGMYLLYYLNLLNMKRERVIELQTVEMYAAVVVVVLVVSDEWRNHSDVQPHEPDV